MTTTTTPCFIIPPHLLQRLAQDSDPRIAECAEHNLTCRHELTAKRQVRAARSSRDVELGGTGLIPPQLGERAQAARPTATTAQAPQAEAGAEQAAAAPNRSIHDAQNGTDLPGTLARKEGDPASGDESVNEAYDGLGDTFDLFAAVYGRNSLDGRGMAMVATVHYEREFANAFWDGEQMVFGDGDGEIFNSFTDSVDVIGHELTHGFTQFTGGLTYVAQPGALNESVSDVFGSLVKQRILGHTADQADWLIGEKLFTDKVNGVALRSMKAPGTAYDDPRLGKDPQPATMDDYQDLPHDEKNDNGGVHINSGIPNHAFYLAAVAIGGNAWEKAGQVWFDVMTSGTLAKDADFKTFADATLKAAGDRFGQDSSEQQAIQKAWQDVKVL
jgi:Zn-dependent metalloprotease